jgi:hypothetical protein
MANLLDLSPDEFMFTLQEFGYAPERRDELIRQYREHNSVFGALNRAAQERQAEIAGEGRRPVAGGFLSKPEGSLGMDAVRGLRVEPMAGLLGMLTGAGRAVEAPAAAYQGLIPMADVPLEALGTAGMASLGGAAMTRPAGSVGMGGRVASGESRAQTVARLLREGRQSEVTDDLLATLTPNDNAELLRLYNEGATGMDLPMDEASRMARARAAYEQAVKLASENYDNVGIRTVESPEFLTTESVRWDDGSRIPNEFIGGTSATDAASPNAFEAHPNTGFSGSAPQGSYFGDYSGVLQSNRASAGEDFGEIVMRNPELAFARSRFARFDPRLSDNANLLAANRDQTVGLLSTAAAAEPRNAAERMARDILDMRAAGRAGEVTDEMMAQADPQYMFRLYQAGETGMVLPMDVQSRMRRAEDMGFDMMADLYHGSARDGFVDTTDIKAFDPSRVGDRWNADTQGFSMTTAQRDANYYAQPGDSAIRRGDFGDGVVYPLMDASQRPLQMRVGPLDGTISAWDDRPSDTYDVINRGGYDSARLNADGVEMRVVMDPRNIRSRFARFDPEFAHLANLSAANIDPLAGLFGALAAEEQRRQRNSQ